MKRRFDFHLDVLERDAAELIANPPLKDLLLLPRLLAVQDRLPGGALLLQQLHDLSLPAALCQRELGYERIFAKLRESLSKNGSGKS